MSACQVIPTIKQIKESSETLCEQENKQETKIALRRLSMDGLELFIDAYRVANSKASYTDPTLKRSRRPPSAVRPPPHLLLSVLLKDYKC